MHTITLDGGTSNTRFTLWHGQVVCGRHQTPVGVRDNAAAGHSGPLREAVRTGLQSLLNEAGLTAESIGTVLASGMIGAKAGLFELPHVDAPAGLHDLAHAMVPVDLPGIWPQPIWFVPGVRRLSSQTGLHNVEHIDMMRGEETEAMGWLAAHKRAHGKPAGPLLLVLPGSHTKVVHLDAEGRIRASATTMAGELLQLLTQHSLLAATLGGHFADTLDHDALLAGARLGQRVGLGRAAFTVRSLALFTDSDHHAQASFLLGIVLADDARAIAHSQALPGTTELPIWVCGKAPLAEALVSVLQAVLPGSRTVWPTPSAWQADLAGQGALLLAAERDLSGAPTEDPHAP